MTDRKETSTDIIAEMRGAKTEFPFVYLIGEPDTPEVVDFKTKKIIEPRKINIRRVTVKELADRLEAAHKRERGDVAKLREALEFCVKGMCGFCRMDAEARGMMTRCVHGCEALLMAEAALAAPPRNCDVGTADEQFERFGPFCNRYDDDCTGCPCDTDSSSWNFTNCFARWAQMPYEEGGAK